MSDDEPRSGSPFRRLLLLGAAVLTTLAMLALALTARVHQADAPPLTLRQLTDFGFDPYVIGYVFQDAILPLGLLYLLSSTALFRRWVAGERAPGDAAKLFGGLALIQGAALLYGLGRHLGGGEPEPVMLKLLVVVVGGLLGGWPMGLGLGLFSLFLRGTQELLFYDGSFLADLYRAGELTLLSGPGRDLFLRHYLFDLWVPMPVWAGFVAGAVAELLGPRRFAPGAALALGAGIELGAGYLIALSGPDISIPFLIPNMLVSGLSLAAVALMVRNVQSDVARRQAQAAELARAQAELRALRAQINPHFLFNALNTIRYFVHADPAAARRLLLSLSEIFQRVLRSGEFVRLQDELRYVQAYLDLERARRGERLRIEWRVEGRQVDSLPDLALGDLPLPTLIFQPLVENAVLHGIAPRPEGGLLRIIVGRQGGDLVLRVEDDGPGIAPERLAALLHPGEGGVPQGREAIGLRNVDGRLRAIYGPAYGLTIESEVGQGTSAQIRIPIKGG